MPDYNEGTANFAFVEPERDPALDVGRGQKQVRQRRSFQHKRPPPRLFGDVFERVRADYVEKPDDSKAPAATDSLRPCDPRYGVQRGRTRGQMQQCAAGKFHFEPPSRFTSLDHLVGGDEQSIWYFEAKRLRGLEVDHKLELCR
jgi:hypothetical protein